MSRQKRGWMSFCLAVGLLAGGLPAEASEVVKLARLVVSGKRGPAETARTTPAESPRSTASSSSTSSQTHASNGGTDDSGTAPAPTRGVVY